MLKMTRRSLALILVLVSTSLLCWAGYPNQQESYSQTTGLADIQALSGGMNETPLNMNPKRVIVEWPGSMRIGETEEITLSYEPLDGTDPAVVDQTDEDKFYDQYSLMAEGRFEVAGMKVTPREAIRESMPAGQAVKLRWQISTDQAGDYKSTVWLSLRLLPLDGNQVIQVPIFIREINIQATSLLGMSEAKVYLLGGVGLLLAGFIASKDILNLVRKFKTQKSRSGNHCTQ
jgi:hypothetical protein